MIPIRMNGGFNKWNPMEADYMNAEFNQYISGPGANLEEELQPARQALQKRAGDNAEVPTLVFKNLPKEMTKHALYNICSRHGKVREVRDSKKNSFYFVDMVTVGDMEAVFRALADNNYGFEILVGKEKKKSPLNAETYQSGNNPSIVLPKSTGIDFENRKYRTSKKNHQRPKVGEDNPFNIPDMNVSGLPMNLLLNDAHSLERQGLNKFANNDRYSYRNGRSCINMPEKTQQFIDKKHKESSGRYDDNDDKFVHSGEGNIIPNNIAKCSQCYYACDTVCARCTQYYCSAECQKNDWPEHRYKCGKPVHLQRTPPPKKQIQADNISPKAVQDNDKKAAVSETAKDVVENAPTVESKKLKAIPRQLQSLDKKVIHQNPTSSNPSPPQVENFQKTSSKQVEKRFEQSSSKQAEIPSQQSSAASKSSAKRLPAALRNSSEPCSNNRAKSTQQQASSQKFSSPNLSASLTASEDHSNSLENSVEVYKRNMPRSGNIVTMTAICKTNVVFIRSTTYEANLSYIHTVDTLQLLGKKLRPLKTLPKSGEVVIAVFQEKFNRALVLSVLSPAKILIHFMDYGNNEQVKLEDLLEAPREFVFKPRHAIPVVLKDVDDVYMTQEIGKFMHAYLNNINVEIRYKPQDFHQDNSVYAVELIDEITQQNLNKIIMKLAKPVEPQDTDEICDRDYLARKILTGGKNVELIVMDNSLMCSGCISCTTKSYALEIEKFKKDIQEYVKSIPNEAYTPRVDELCIAQYSEDGLWYRGVCLETLGDGHPSIHFFDYGNITIVPIESIRRYPRQFTYPIYTVDCAIEGLPEFCDEELVEQLEDLIPNGEKIKCENIIVDEESNFYIISLPNVIRNLQELGLINM